MTGWPWRRSTLFGCEARRLTDYRERVLRSPARLLREFHRAFGLPHQTQPGAVSHELAELRQRLLTEEVDELAEAVRSGEVLGIAHELADVVYIAYGTALTYGIDLDAVLAEVHRSNMTKLDRDGRPVRRADGKVIRSDRYRPPDLARALTGQHAQPGARPERPDDPAVTVRVTSRADVPALAALRRAWAAEQGGGPGDEDRFEERFAEWCAVEEPRRVTWIAEVDGEPAGMVNLAIFERMPWPERSPSRWGYLSNAYVPAMYRSRGIGARLVMTLVEYADQARLARVVLSPSARSVPLYERCGFGAAHMLMARVRRAGGESVD
jgi:predicted HAD superfamily Cof-like phosphohydrolase/GNAT superfamily N-acetyltransferase